MAFDRGSRDKTSSHERVLRAIEHKGTDRLPRDFSAEGSLVERLCERLGLPDGDALGKRFKVDLFYAGIPIHCPYTDGRNIYGIKYGGTPDGLTQNAVTHPLCDAATVDEVEAHAWPDPDWADIEAAKKAALEGRKRAKFVVCSTWGAIFGEAYRLMGMDNFMTGLYERPEVVRAIIRMLTDFYLEVDRRVFTACEGLIDMAYYGNDMGTQRALLFRREQFQEFYVKPFQEMTGQAKRFGLKTMMHSCGAVSDVIPDIIVSGFDVLDPVQYTAEGMHPKRLKRDFGDDIAFHGCVSAQRVLPLGTPDEVRAHVREVCEIMQPGGGYIFTSDQAITSDSPVENVLAMYDEIEKAGH